MINRRTLLSTTLSFVLAGIVGWIRVHIYNIIDETETIGEKPLPITIPPVLPRNQEMVSFFAIGDTGSDTLQRQDVLFRMAQKADQAKRQFTTLLGDNFYENGVASIYDHQWDRDFTRPFCDSDGAAPVYSIRNCSRVGPWWLWKLVWT